MPGKAKVFERIVRSLMLAKLTDGPTASLSSFHSKRYLGKSGHSHEIDVSFEVELAGVKLLVVVECKDYGRKVGVDDVMTFIYRIRDIGAHKGLLVTTRGFQAGAVTVARAEGIGLLLAANGVIEVYLGATYTLYEHWISKLELHVASGSDSVGIVGKRYVQGNCRSRAISFHGLQQHKHGRYQLAFMTPEEASQLESGRGRRKRLLHNTYEKEIPSRKHSKGVVVC